MFQFFPNVYIILSLYAFAGYFYSRFEHWLKVSFDAVDLRRVDASRRYSRRNLVLFSIFLVFAFILTVIDAVMSTYILE